MSNNQLPAETIERIEQDAIKKYQVTGDYDSHEGRNIISRYRTDYIAGATAENSRAQAAIDILEEAYNAHVEEKKILVERYPHLFPGIDNYIKPWVNKAKVFLQQWKEGKEVGDEH